MERYAWKAILKEGKKERGTNKYNIVSVPSYA